VAFSTFAVHAGELDVCRQQVAHVGFIWQERRRRALCRQVGRRLLHDALDWLRAPLQAKQQQKYRDVSHNFSFQQVRLELVQHPIHTATACEE